MTKELPNPLVAAADNSPLVALEDLFREAIAYGAVYFPVIAKKQWDEMRDDKAKQLAGRAELLAADEREAEVRTEAMRWREAIINELVIAHIYSKEHDDNPRKAIQDAISWNCAVALDPAVSSDAQALVEKGRAGMEKDAMRAEQALRKVLDVVRRFLPPDGPSIGDAMNEIIEIVDPWPLESKP